MWRLSAALGVSTLAALAWGGMERSARLLASERLVQAREDFGQCAATLSAYLEGDEIDATIPDDLGGFSPRPEWLLPPE